MLTPEEKRIKDRDRQRKRRAGQKQIREEMGTECLFCGGDDDLVWHHKNPLNKKFNVTSTQSYKQLYEELEKCWCLCNECHIKLHQRLLDPLPHLYD